MLNQLFSSWISWFCSAHRLDCLSLDSFYGLIHLSSDGLSAQADGKVRAPRWKTETRCLETHLRKAASEHRLLQNKDGACLWLVRWVCAATFLSVCEAGAGRWFGLPLDVVLSFSHLGQLRLSTPRCCEHTPASRCALTFAVNSPVCSFSQRHCGTPQHTCCCWPISSSPEGPHSFRAARSSSWDFAFNFIVSVFQSDSRPPC